MSTAPNQAISTSQKFTFHVATVASDGASPDAAAALVVSSTHPEFATAAVDPTDARAVNVTGVAGGNTLIIVDEANPLTDNGRLTMFVAVSPPPPDLRRVDFLNAESPTSK